MRRIQHFFYLKAGSYYVFIVIWLSQGSQKLNFKIWPEIWKKSICCQNNLNWRFFQNKNQKNYFFFSPTSLFIANKWSECLETINFFGTEKNLFSREIFFWQFQNPSPRSSIDPVSRQQQLWYHIGFYNAKKVHLKYKNRHKHDVVIHSVPVFKTVRLTGTQLQSPLSGLLVNGTPRYPDKNSLLSG